MNPEPPVTRSFVNLPRAVWVAGGLLSLVTAGLAGALVMKSVQPAAPVAAVQSAAPAAAAQLAPAVTAPAVTAVAPVPSGKVAALPAARKAVPPARNEPVNAEQAGTWNAPASTLRAAVCAACGTVESVETVKVKGQGTGIGAVAGGVLGGVVGNQVGGGNGKTAMTVLGAIGGGFAGNEVERRTRSETLFDLHVRMEDGSRRVIRQAQAIAAGSRVVVEGNRARVSNGESAAAPHVTRTSSPIDSRT